MRTHVLLGLTKAEIKQNDWALPYKDFLPQSDEDRLLCYADRFHSKGPTFSTFDSFYNGLRSDLPNQAEKFKKWSEDFGVPDIAALAKKYGHPVR